MAVFKQPFVVNTLGKVKEIGYSISIHCHKCHKHTDLDTDKLIERFGADHGSMDRDLRRYFFCQDCREAGRPDRDFGFTLNSGSRAYKNAYAKAKGS